MRSRVHQLLAIAALGAGLAAALSSCGSGMVAGIEGTGAKVASVASGPISRFGSIFVNGVEYDTTTATILIDGRTDSAGALRAGEVVAVRGSIDPNGTTGKATEVAYDANVAGPIGAADSAASSLTVLGQTVRIGPQTSLASDTGGSPAFSAFAPGALVEVSGFANANGVIAATRVELKSQLPAYLITGTISSADPAAMQLALNGATIDYSAAVLVGFATAGSPQAGDTVRIEIVPGAYGGAIPAARITLLSRLTAAAGVEGQVEGEVTRFASSADFDVDDVRVATDAQTQFQNGTAATLAADVHVSVEGRFDASGTLLASLVRFDQSDPILLRATVGALDAATNSLTVLGVGVTTDAETRFEDESATPVSPFNLGSLAVGDTVEIHGRTTAANAVHASLLTREQPSGAVEIRGTATVASDPNLTVLGVAAVTGASTQYFDSSGASIPSAQFYAAAAGGAVVDLSGTSTGGVLDVAAARLPGAAELED